MKIIHYVFFFVVLYYYSIILSSFTAPLPNSLCFAYLSHPPFFCLNAMLPLSFSFFLVLPFPECYVARIIYLMVSLDIFTQQCAFSFLFFFPLGRWQIKWIIYGLLLALAQGTLFVILRVSYVVPGIEPWLAICRLRALSTVLCLYSICAFK